MTLQSESMLCFCKKLCGYAAFYLPPPTEAPSFEKRARQDALRAYLFYASNAGRLAHVRSLRASNQTAEIPGQARNDDISLVPHYVLGAPVKEALIKALSDFAKSIFMQGKEKDDENSKLFKESFDEALYKYAAKSDSSI